MIKLLRTLVPLLVVLLLASACGASPKTAESTPTTSSSGTPSADPTTAAGDCTYETDSQPAAKKAPVPPAKLPEGAPATLTIKTNHGDINVSLAADKAPCTVNSFLSLAKAGYYDNTTCHRLVDDAPGSPAGGLYVLQCGDPSGTGSGGPGYSFADELIDNDPRLQPCQDINGTAVCTYNQGTVAMANAGPDTNGSQFFLVFKNSQLPNSYTDFATMDAAGVKVVQQIAAGGFDANDPNTPPKTSTTIESIS